MRVRRARERSRPAKVRAIRILELLPGVAAVAVLLASAHVLSARADVTIAEIASDQSADRIRRLLEGAKREGVVTLYTSATVDDMGALTTAFEKKYGVKVRVWRASSEHIVQRGVVEAGARRFDADLFETEAAGMESLHREGLLQRIKLAAFADLMPAAVPAHGDWIGTRYNVFAAAYNTKAVKAGERPARYDDLTKPYWKGKLAVEADDSDWFGGVVSELGEERGLNLFKSIVASNGISVRKGHTLLANLVATGEVPFSLSTYAYKAEQLKRSGAPIDWFVIPPGIARFQAAGVARHAPHPHAALLFFEFLLTDAQELMPRRSVAPASQKFAPPIDIALLKFLDSTKTLDERNKWSRYFNEVIGRAR